MRIVFMGTPEIAVASLEALINAGFDIVGVVTTPDKPAGRGKQLHQSDVKRFALEHNLYLMQPEKLKDPVFISELENLKPELQVVVAFRMLPKIVWNLPPLGTVNMHASLLPNYRGAAPINHAIINGEKESGVTTFLLNEDIDTGDILFYEKIALDDKETAGSLHDKLMALGANLIVKTAQTLAEHTAKPIVQDLNQPLFPAPKIFKNDCEIDWFKPSVEVERLIRGLSPYPTAFSRLDDELSLKIYEADIDQTLKREGLAYDIYSDDKQNIWVCAGDNRWIKLIDIQLSGKKRMKVEDFLRGFSGSKYSHFLKKLPNT